MTETARTRRTEIVDAAAALFDRTGYHTTSMSEIAGAVGIAKPSLYHYFRSKDDILFEIHGQFIDLLLARHDARRDRDPSPATELLDLMSDMIDLMATHKGHVRVFFEHHRDLSEEQRREVLEKRDRYFGIVEGTIVRGIELGDFRPVDVPLATLAVFGACNWTYQWFQPDGSVAAREVAKEFWSIMIEGMARRESPST